LNPFFKPLPGHFLNLIKKYWASQPFSQVEKFAFKKIPPSINKIILQIITVGYAYRILRRLASPLQHLLAAGNSLICEAIHPHGQK
jgi:hypothetical protein